MRKYIIRSSSFRAMNTFFPIPFSSHFSSITLSCFLFLVSCFLFSSFLPSSLPRPLPMLFVLLLLFSFGFLIRFLINNDILSLINPLDPFNQGETAMGDRGSKDKGKKEERKKAKLNPKEKRRLKNEKKNPTTYTGIPR